MATTKSTTTTTEAPAETDPKQKTEEKQAGRAETIQEQGIGPQDPYPTGSPAEAKEKEPQPVKDNPNV